MSSTDHRLYFSDFTEAGYRELLRIARRNYAFCGFRDVHHGRHVLWRHDVDISMHRALRLAEIEAEEGVRATYFVLPRSIFYNLLSTDIQKLVLRILALGHELGLHFDPVHLGALARGDLVQGVSRERDLLHAEFGALPTAVSFHQFGDLRAELPDDLEVAGLANAYSGHLLSTYGYVSDSNGLWRHRRLRDVLSEAREDRLQVLTHPEWWTPEVLAPRLRVQRAIDGYAQAMAESYDATLAQSGRPNLR